MEFIIAELINNPKIPKWLRYVIVIAICGAIIVLGVMLAIKAPCLQAEFSEASCPLCLPSPQSIFM